MSNVVTAAQIRNALPYKAVASTDAAAGPIEYTQDRYEQAGDGMSLSVNDALHTTVVAVKASAGKVYQLEVISPSGAANGVTVQLFNAATGDVNLGTTVPKDLVFCPATETVVVNVFSGGSANRYGTAISVACTQATSLSAQPAAADRPTVNVKYA